MERKRKTKIVATLGPASEDPRELRRLLRAGLDVARFNMSHGTHDEHRARLAALREAAAEAGREVGALVDLQGPKIRTGRLRGGVPVRLETGAEVRIRSGDFEGTAGLLATAYEHLARDVAEGHPVLMDDGMIELRVEAVEDGEVAARVIEGGLLGEHKGINLPRAEVAAPAVTAKDRRDILFAAEADVDFLALSFVRRAEDVETCRALARRAGADLPIVAKIEKPQAVDRIEAILEAADGIMVARGDLGVEMSPEAVPVLQKTLIRQANERRKLVITATQMLESMVQHPRPTRAEAADVANAIFDGSDAVMLSAETAAGLHPVRAVAMMNRIACRAEASTFFHGRPDNVFDDLDDSEELSMAHAAYTASLEYRADAFLVYTLSGKTAVLLSKTRPAAPILALSSERSTVRRLALAFGVTPLLMEPAADTDAMIAAGEAAVRARGLLPEGAKVIVLSGEQRAPGGTNMMQIKRL